MRMMHKPYRILIISPNWVGDAVMAQVLVQGLLARDPYCHIDVLTPSSCADVWLRAGAGIQTVFQTALRHRELQWIERWRWSKRFRGKYDQVIILPNSLKSALIPFLAKIPRRTGFK